MSTPLYDTALLMLLDPVDLQATRALSDL
jgi:hypothetical protein